MHYMPRSCLLVRGFYIGVHPVHLAVVFVFVCEWFKNVYKRQEDWEPSGNPSWTVWTLADVGWDGVGELSVTLVRIMSMTGVVAISKTQQTVEKNDCGICKVRTAMCGDSYLLPHHCRQSWMCNSIHLAIITEQLKETTIFWNNNNAQ